MTPYTIVRVRADSRVLVVDKKYRTEVALRHLGDQLRNDFARLPVLFAIVFDDPKAAALFERMSESGGSINKNVDAFYDLHMIASYSKNRSTGVHEYAIWPNGAQGKQIDIRW